MTVFASKTPRDLNHDPAPFVFPETGMRSAAEFGPYIPRPEFDHAQHNEPNPVLVAFREHVEVVSPNKGDWANVPNLAGEWLEHFSHYWEGFRGGRIARVGHRTHARRVLTRLANLSRIGDNT